MVSFILPGNSASTGYEVANSLRFDHGSTDYLNKSVGGNSTLNTKGTFSTWLKRATTADSKGALFSGYIDVNDRLYITTNSDTLFIFGKVSGTTKYNMQVNRNLRDPSAWMNIVVAVDTTQGTAADRVKAYINGVQQTITITTSPDQNSAIPWSATSSYNLLVGRIYATQLEQGLDGYQAETVFVDGQALDQTSFGKFDSDSPSIWKPKNVSGLTFGNNGFYLEYKQSGTSQNSSGLGADTSGNDNHFAVNNLTSVDQSTDTCTNNFATLNPLVPTPDASWSEGNLKITGSDATEYSSNNPATIGVSSGKWYIEVEYDSAGSNTNPYIGICPISASATTNMTGSVTDACVIRMDNELYIEGSATQNFFGSSISAGNTIGIALDMDNQKVWFHLNGTYPNSGNPATGSNAAFSGITSGETMTFCARALNGVFKFNFGSPIFTISSGNSDGNGYGNFEYSVPSGYYALNTKNLAEYG